MKHPILLALAIVGLGSPLGAEEHQHCAAEVAVCVHEMAEHFRTRGWVGIRYEMDEARGGVILEEVIPDSPAAAAGLLPGDRVVALDGVAYSRENEAKLKKLHKAFKPGDRIRYTIAREGREMEVEVRLGAIPEQVLALWIGQHVLAHHAEAPERSAEATP